jgi:hypothetical protein
VRPHHPANVHAGNREKGTARLCGGPIHRLAAIKIKFPFIITFHKKAMFLGFIMKMEVPLSSLLALDQFILI